MRQIIVSLSFLLLLIVSCKDDKYIVPSEGKVAFSLSPIQRNNGRVSETVTPAFVLLSIKDSHDNVQENIKLPLFVFGESHLSENIELPTGAYQLTQFAILDANNKVIYATPLEGADLAQYVNDPLPIQFTVNNEEETQVIPQVLAVMESDRPENFGYASFGFEVVKPKLKTLSDYRDDYPNNPGVKIREQFRFYYDDNGRLISYDLYVPTDLSGNYRRKLHFDMDYGFENSNAFYNVTGWTVVNDNLDTIGGRRKVYLDANSNFVRDIIYDFTGQEVIRENIYTYYAGGFEVKERARWLGADGKFSVEFGITRIVYDTDEAGNITRQRIYNSHAEGSNVEERVEREYVYTHDSKANPLYKFHPYFTSLGDWGRYPDSFSKNNVTKITPVGCVEDYCSVDFAYTYQNGYVAEMSPGGFFGITKRAFEYY